MTGGSDRFVDDLVAWGTVEQVRAHLAAGADHVAVQVLTGAGTASVEDQWACLAAPLLADPAP